MSNKYIGSICFVRSGTQPSNLLSYQNILNKENVGVYAVCDGVTERVQYDSSIKVYCFEEWLKSRWDVIDVKELRLYQKKYYRYNLWEIYYTDRYMRYKYTYDDAAKILIGLLTFWENVFVNENTICIAADCIIGAYNFFGMIVGEQYDVQYISFPTARFKKYVTYFSIGEGYSDFLLDKLLEENYTPTQEEYDYVALYLAEYVKARRQPFYMTAGVNQTRKIKKSLIQLVKKTSKISYLWDGRFNDKFDSKVYRSRWAVFNPLIESLRSKKIWKYFCEPDYENDKYVLFPLHFQPEASTCVYARKYENQLFFLEQLAKSIPAGLMIYVKEHSVRLGHRPLSFYEELRKFPNIKIIAPNTNIHELITKAEFLVVLTSTAGYEALMYGKPVFVCGNVFYERFSGVKKLKDVFDEKQEFLNPPAQNRELYIRQMACYFKSIDICSTVEEQIRDEDAEKLCELRKKSMKSLLDFLEIPNRIVCSYSME